ncbi:MAG: TonB-dependent receptor domain-containing protein [Candidatus Sulfotelmatobacter sp.]
MKHLPGRPPHVASLILILLFAAWVAPIRTWAQADRGAVKGDTQDTQKASVPGVKLALRNEATGVVASATSESSGQFSFPNLAPGAYTLTAEATGFSKSVQQHIEVGVGSTVALTITLQPGQVQQTVTISAASAAVDTQTSDIGTTITPEEIKDLPVSLNSDSRNPLNFVVLSPGVNGSTPGASPDYRLHVSGGASYGNEVYVDGVPIMNPNLTGDISLDHPPIDSIGQFKLINNNQTAQYGLSSGIVSFAFKSGTNDFHGSLFDFLQNDALNASGYTLGVIRARPECQVSPLPDTCKKAPLKQNEYGGTFGGPLWIPKIYNGHDKTFFFVDYTGFAYRPSSNNSTLTTLPNAFRTGDFSQLLGSQMTDSSGRPIFDPAGRPVYEGAIYDPFSVHTVVGPDGKSYQVRDPFPGNVIPAGSSSLSAVAQNVIKSFPTASNNAVFNNFVRQQSSKIDENRFVAKIDEHISEKHSVSGSVFVGDYTKTNNGGLNLLDAIGTTNPTKQIRLTYNYAHSATLLNSLNIGYLRDNNKSGTITAGPGLESLGLQGLPPLSPDSPYPLIGTSGASDSIGSAAPPAVSIGNRYYASDSVTMIRGKHSFTFGGEVRREQLNNLGLSDANFTFATAETGLNGTLFAGGQVVANPGGTGNGISSLLTGGPDYVHIDYPIAQYYRWLQTGFFVQDDWRVTPNLTLNLGLRYDIQVPRTEKYGNVSTVDPTLPNPSAGGIPGAYAFYGSGQGRNGKPRIGNIDYKGFQPRIGFAYSPDPAHRTAIRGGLAITRPLGNDNMQGGFTGGYNFDFAGIAQASRAGDYLGSPAYYWDTSFPANGVVPPASTLTPGFFVGNDNPVWIGSNVGLPPTQIYWTTQIQQQIANSMVMNIGYVGSHTYHLGTWSKPNALNPPEIQAKYSAAAQAQGLPLEELLTLPITDSRAAAAGIIPPWPDFATQMGASATVAQALRPFPQYGSMDHPLNPVGSTSYNALQSSLQKRFSEGLTFLLSYTFSKTIGNVDSNSGPSAGAENAIFAGSFFQNYYDAKSERAVTSSDIPHVVSLSYTYELPFGQGKRLLNHGGVVNKVVGGWSVSGIHQYQSGRPIHIEVDYTSGSTNPYLAAGDGFSFRPNIVPGRPFKNPAYKRSCSGPVQTTAGRNPCQFYINPGAFTPAPTGTFGNAPNLISSLRMPAYINEDLSLSKRTAIFERMDLQFQANFFNAFNRTIFSSNGNANTFILNAGAPPPPTLESDSIKTSNTVFGIMTDQQNAPRIIQFGMKLEF